MSATPRTKADFHGYFPGVIGMITEAHAVYYHEYWGFDVSFETQVGRELSEFMAAFQEGRDGLWVATAGPVSRARPPSTAGRPPPKGPVCAGSSSSPLQGTGLGKALLARAVDFCRQMNCPRAYLWTFKGLDAARALYEPEGFRLCEEHVVNQWGQKHHRAEIRTRPARQEQDA